MNTIRDAFLAGRFPMLLAAAIAAGACLAGAAAPALEGRTIRVLVWDERQEEQKHAYPDYLGTQIADSLKGIEGLEVRSASLKDPEQGLADEAIEWADVIIWWGHIRHRAVKREKVEKIVSRLKEGKLGLIPLHSALTSLPFLEAMRERTIEDALRSLAPEERARAAVEMVKGEKGKRTPSAAIERRPDGAVTVKIVPPTCMIARWEEHGKPSHVTVLKPDHPIARGIPRSFDIPSTEMYAEPFEVPEPDEVVFEERWDDGVRFRSGCAWNVGKGKVFYFRPGHETYKVFFEKLPLQIVANAVLWTAPANRPGLSSAAVEAPATLEGDRIAAAGGDLVIRPVEHATLVLAHGSRTIYVDPVGGAGRFASLPAPDLILITDIHGDHLDPKTVAAVKREDTAIAAPQAVAEKLPGVKVAILKNGDRKEVAGIAIEAVPMYNLTPERQRFHVQGRGNGYVILLGGKRIYISGDTEDIPEMRGLKNIDIAFVCMNLPYTMTVEKAADAVREFKPGIVYPYHYRGGGGKSDIQEFKKLVGSDLGVDVRLREWYP